MSRGKPKNYNYKCGCYSVNGDFGTTPPVKLRMLSAVLPDGKREYKDVSIDACLVPVIQHLWDNGVNTANSCCGHGIINPSIVLGDGVENYSHIHELIEEKDSRRYQLMQWKKVIV